MILTTTACRKSVWHEGHLLTSTENAEGARSPATPSPKSKGSRIISDAPKSEKPNTGVKLLHARLEMSGDRESLLANLRVLMPDEGRVTVEW